MVAQQVLRVAAVTLLSLALPSSAVADRVDPGDEIVVIIDLRRGDATERRESREALERALVGIQGVAPSDDSDLRSALAGERADPLASAARSAFDAAASAYGKLDCKTAAERSKAAITALAAMQARGDSVDSQLTQAYVYPFLCADKFADVDRARTAASMLRRLDAGDPPPGISQSIWANYPEVDAATNVLMTQLTVDGPEGSEVWIDHQRAGLAPVAAVVSEGPHLIAAATETGAAAEWISASGVEMARRLEIEDEATAYAGARDTVAAWRSGQKATPEQLAELITSVGHRVALVLAQEGKIEVWGVSKPGRPAQLLGSAARAIGVGAIVNERVAGWSRGAGPDPDRELLRESPEDRMKQKKKPLKWWVYASIIGAVAVGTAIVIANETADDRQRIEVSF